MEFLIQGRSIKMKKLLTAILPSMLSQLHLTNSKKCLVIVLEDELDQMGLTIEMPGVHGFLVAIKVSKSWRDMLLTLAHELVHVSQMASGKLKNLPNGAKIWAGKKYKKSTPYLNQPWELNAFARQELILRRALEE